MTFFDILNKNPETLAFLSTQGGLNLFREAEESLDPTDEHFDFSLWAKAVKKQMVQSLERRNKSKIGTKP